jgi:hypothetical protein
MAGDIDSDDWPPLTGVRMFFVEAELCRFEYGEIEGEALRRVELGTGKFGLGRTGLLNMPKTIVPKEIRKMKLSKYKPAFTYVHLWRDRSKNIWFCLRLSMTCALPIDSTIYKAKYCINTTRKGPRK